MTRGKLIVLCISIVDDDDSITPVPLRLEAAID